MTAEEMAQCWVPVQMRWRHIQPGDVIVGKDGAQLWMVSGAGEDGGQWRIDASWSYVGTVTQLGDPDQVATVLLPGALRDAMELTRAELGARLLERREAA